MVYALTTTLHEWDSVASVVSRALIDKQVVGVPLQQSDIPEP